MPPPKKRSTDDPLSPSWIREIEAFRTYLMLERNLSAHTLEAYGRDLKGLAVFATERHRAPEECTRTDVEAYAQSLVEGGLHPRSMARQLSAWRSFYAFLALNDKVGSNPAADIPAPTLGRKLPVVLDLSEIDAMIDCIELGTPGGHRDKAIVETLYGCGLRVSELLDIKLQDIFEREGVLRIIGKGDKQRLVPLSSTTLECIALYRDEVRALGKVDPGYRNHLFLNLRGQRLSRVYVFQMLRDLAAKAGIHKTLGPHTFRHSYASHLVNNGADLRAVQELLGHSSITTTELYAHLDSDRIRQALRDFHPRARKN
ncbi:tyrosine recombinase [bacterium]|nr:tyrosine recombinase [bacterium]